MKSGINSKSKGLSETIQADKPQGKFKKSCICKSAKENIGIILDLKKGNPIFFTKLLTFSDESGCQKSGSGRVLKIIFGFGSGFEIYFWVRVGSGLPKNFRV